MNLLCSADETDGRQTETPVIEARFCCGDYFGVVCKAQIVICAHVEHVMGLCGVDASPLLSRYDSLVFVGARFANFFKLFCEY